MSDPYVNVQGYAVPWLQAGRCAGRMEFFDPSAFDSQLRGDTRAFLNYGDHGAPSICHQIQLFKDVYGLGFLAAIPREKWLGIARGVLSDCQYCSIYTTDEKTVPDQLSDGESAARITQARILHVTLACADVVYSGTGCWPSTFDGKMPRRLAELRARWIVGRQAWLANEKRRQAERDARWSANPARATAHGTQTRNAINDRSAAFQSQIDARAAIFQLLIADRLALGGGMGVIGHLAFSKKYFSYTKFSSQIERARAVGRRGPSSGSHRPGSDG